jgi:phosphomethylpyrimidine synthase
MKYYIGNNQRNIKNIPYGENMYPPIITSIGISEDYGSFEKELSKAKFAIKAGASIINDNSLNGHIFENYKRFLLKLSVPFATVGINSLAKKINSGTEIHKNEFVDNIIQQINMGVDIITLHATIFKEDFETINNTNRIIPCTSRGGLLMLKYMNKSNIQNPFWLNFDDILKCAKKNNATISLCVSFRPASIFDCSLHNDLYWIEIQRIAKLIEKAKMMDVNIMVEGIGHCPINLIPSIIRETKKICYDAPYRILAVSTDIALGYDHISSAIVTAIAIENGADVVTCVTRAEHVGLPSSKEIFEGVISTKIAIHSGYIARTRDYRKDISMAKARMKNGCIGEINAAIDPSSAKKSISKHKYYNGEKKCEMCGENCSLDILENISNKKQKKVQKWK